MIRSRTLTWHIFVPFLAIIVLALTVKLFLDLVLTPSDLVSLAPAKGGGH